MHDININGACLVIVMKCVYITDVSGEYRHVSSVWWCVVVWCKDGWWWCERGDIVGMVVWGDSGVMA